MGFIFIELDTDEPLPDEDRWLTLEDGKLSDDEFEEIQRDVNYEYGLETDGSIFSSVTGGTAEQDEKLRNHFLYVLSLGDDPILKLEQDRLRLWAKIGRRN